MIAARSNIFSTQKKSQGKISVGGLRAEAHDPYATPSPPSAGRECDLYQRGGTLECNCAKNDYSPVAFNDIKHLARSMPADGLEAQDVVPARCGCWVAHKAIFRRGDRFLVRGDRFLGKAHTLAPPRPAFPAFLRRRRPSAAALHD